MSFGVFCEGISNQQRQLSFLEDYLLVQTGSTLDRVEFPLLGISRGESWYPDDPTPEKGSPLDSIRPSALNAPPITSGP